MNEDSKVIRIYTTDPSMGVNLSTGAGPETYTVKLFMLNEADTAYDDDSESM